MPFFVFFFFKKKKKKKHIKNLQNRKNKSLKNENKKLEEMSKQISNSIFEAYKDGNLAVVQYLFEHLTFVKVFKNLLWTNY